MPKRQVGNVVLHYEYHDSQVPNSAPVVLLLHGLGSSTLDWADQLPALTPIYKVLLIDLRGHGKSEKPAGPYSIKQMAYDVAKLTASLNLVNLHVVGLSMGAQVALQLALDYPSVVASVTAVNSPANMIPQRLQDKWAVLLRKLLVTLLGMRRLGHIIAGKLLPGEEFTQRRQLFAERWAANDPAAYSASFNAIIEWDITPSLSLINRPLLVVAARDDYTPMQWKEQLAEGVPGARLIIVEDSRHATPVERPSAFNCLLLEFLESQPTIR